MIPWSWKPGRVAREALAAGRLEEARRLLEPHAAVGHRKALSLLAEVGEAFRVRGERALAADHPEAAWDDLLACEAVAPANPKAGELRTTLTKLAAATCRAAFLAGNLEYVRACVARFKERAAVHPAFDWIPPAASNWQAALDLADQGDFAAAMGLLERTRSRLPTEASDGLGQAQRDLAGRSERARAARQQLFEAVERKEWSEVHRWADELLSVAPEHRDARRLQAEAWGQLTGEAPASKTGSETGSVPKPDAAAAEKAFVSAPTVGFASPSPPASRAVSQAVSPTAAPAVSRSPSVAPRRLHLSLDGVGAFLLLLNPRITIGAEANPARIDVPVTAGLQRVHAEIARDDEGGYLIEPSSPAAAVSVNGESVTSRRVLKSGDEVKLGAACRFRFDLPNEFSATAILTPLSAHRMAGYANALVMVASNLIVGPDEDAHLPVPKADADLVFYTTADGLGVRTDGTIRVRGMAFTTNAVLPVPCDVETDEYRFRLDVYNPRS